jgi:uncharacterized protein (DUF488 family)
LTEIYTIGHSTHETAHFIRLLQQHGITAVSDLRSHPYSRYNPQFNRETLQRDLKGAGIAYVFLGNELGPRSEDPDCYIGEKVSYRRLARTEPFSQGLRRLETGMKQHRIALMCSEKDPITCHRMILVCRHLRAKDRRIRHILEDGALEENPAAEKRLMKALKIPPADLFNSQAEQIERAYDRQGERIAHVRKD